MSEAALAVAASEPAPQPTAPPWPLAARIGFRFLVSYFALYQFRLLENSDLPWEWLSLAPLWHRLVPWLGHHALGIHAAISGAETGSGDKLYDWLLVAQFAVVAALATVIWSVVDRRRARYDRLAALFHVFVRYHLAIQMITYGIAKVIPSQFPPPGPSHITETFGEMSPMRVLWSFMGASTVYVIFCGLAELAGGILLWFRRTATLGAVVSAGVLVNVVMLNYCYDVPVKLLSSHLLLMAVIVLAPDGRRLADLLVLQRPTTPRAWAWIPKTRRGRVARVVGKLAVFALFAGFSTHASLASYRGRNAQPAMFGVYDVEAQDGTSYRAAYVSTRTGALRDDAGVAVRFTLPTANGRGEATARDGRKGSVALSSPDADHLVVDGNVATQKLSLRLKRRTTPPLFRSRGFHFVNEFPFNR